MGAIALHFLHQAAPNSTSTVVGDALVVRALNCSALVIAVEPAVCNGGSVGRAAPSPPREARSVQQGGEGE